MGNAMMNASHISRIIASVGVQRTHGLIFTIESPTEYGPMRENWDVSRERLKDEGQIIIEYTGKNGTIWILPVQSLDKSNVWIACRTQTIFDGILEILIAPSLNLGIVYQLNILILW